ncbi:MAG: glycosyltransferase family 39 protein [Candidatus Hydrogenedentes bacterium]|nr:glycosyltransferase family 39 protein [Candidatus Hydrogenedentota bacterium]
MNFLNSHKNLLLLIIATAFLSSAAFQGSRGLYETTEGRYAECARQMVARGNLLEPVLNNQFHWSKPPLAYWCIAAGMEVFGQNAWGVRACLVIAFVLTVLAVYHIGTLLWGESAGLFSALVYSTSPFTLVTANVISTDVILTLWETMSILFFWIWVRRKKSRFIILMWLAAALGFMTKGPVALMPMFAIIPTWILVKRRDPDLRSMFHPLGIVVFLVVGLSWYVYESAIHPGLLRYWLMDETVGRNLHGKFGRNPEFYNAFLIYLPILCFGTGQWIVVLASKYKHIPWPRDKWLRPLEWTYGIEWTYLILNVFIPLAIFSLATSKLPLYVLPLLVPVSLAVGKGLDWLVATGKVRTRFLLKIAAAVVLIVVVGKGLSPYFPSSKDMKRLAADITPILKKYPNHQLYSKHRFGLQFYLGYTIPDFAHFTISDVMKNSKETGLVSLVLCKSHNLAKLDKQYNISRFTIETANPFWSVIVATEPKEKRSNEQRSE